jgi:transcription factor SOX9 (SOX group E)
MHLAQSTSDDANSSLTSQTLNADGTPKRPMNAFMIFARRRRPQVSAENQSMRTGDVSKILSREWNAMDSVTYFLLVFDVTSDL